MDFPRRQQLVRTVIDKVTVVDDRVEIVFKIPLPASLKEGRSPGSRLSRLRRERQDPPKARLPEPSPSALLRPAQRSRAFQLHGQRPRLQRHRPRLVPAHGADPYER